MQAEANPTATGESGKTSWFIVFGAAVRPDGSPSGTLSRRVEGAWDASQRLPSDQQTRCQFIVTGAQGRYGPSEARVMRSLLLELGALPQQIILEEQATDTMQSAFLCRDILLQRAATAAPVYVCSSPYHSFRCQMLLHMLGIAAQRAAMPSDLPSLGVAKWLWYYFREMLALPWDFIHIFYLIKTNNR